MPEPEITQLLGLAAEGDTDAFDQVAAWAYAELERLADRRMRRRYGRLDGLTLEPAALVNETFLRLLEKPVGFANRRHFLAFASQVMLGALADYGRRRSAKKRGGDRLRVTLSGLTTPADDQAEVPLAALADALRELDALDPRKGDIVKLRVLWGASNAEVARLLEVSESTAERDWRFSRLWLGERLGLGA